MDRNTWTIKDVLEWTTNYFTQKGLVTPRLDAEVLLAYSLGVDRLYLYLHFERPLSKGERETYRHSVIRRVKREPTALITGKKEFWSHGFRVIAGVLIPRPDTETLVECMVKEMGRLADPVVLEIGIGSGAVAVSLLREHKRAVVFGTDVSMAALKLAMDNAVEADVGERFHVVAMDLFAAMRPGFRFDMICSNPPYIPSRDIETLEPEIRFFEPLSALDGGMDGLDFIRKIVHQGVRFLKPHGVLALEVGDGQSDMVSKILTHSLAIENVSVIRDLAGKDRVVMGFR